MRAPALMIAAVAFSALASAEEPARIHFPGHGFTIDPLESPAGNVQYMLFHMALEPVNGFSDNINVMIQPYTDSLDDYVATTKEQMEQAQFELVKAGRSADSRTFEYRGSMNGRNHHWYAKVVRYGLNHVYLVTATSTASTWPQNEKKLRRCVDSFALTKQAASAGLPISPPVGN